MGVDQAPVIYIGKNIEKPIWYFVSVKDGFCRFLHFGFSPLYPFWMAGMNTGKGVIYSVPDKMSPSPCPREVWDEVKLFVTGKVKYEPVPSRKGKRASVTRICTDEEGKAVNPTLSVRESLRLNDPPTKPARKKESDPSVRGSECSTSGPVVKGGLLPEAPKSKRRRDVDVVRTDGGGQLRSKLPSGETPPSIRKKRGPNKPPTLVAAAKVVPGVNNSNQQEVIPMIRKSRQTAKVTLPVSTPEIPAKRGRGRPRTRPFVATPEDKIKRSKVLKD